MAKSKKSSKKIKKNPASKFFSGYLFLFFILLFVFFISLFPKNTFELSKNNLIVNPHDLSSRFLLIEELISHHQLNEARTELVNLRNQDSDKVLGASIEIDRLWQNYQENNPQELEKLIIYWEKFNLENPTYLPAYVYLAYYYSQLGKNDLAQSYLHEALILDPTFEPAKEFEAIIK